MWESKAGEILFSRAEAQAQDRLLRHYRQIGAPAVAAALDVGTEKSLRQDDEQGLSAGIAEGPAFLFAEDRAA